MSRGRVGVDVGGTFTDAIVAVGERVGVAKVPTTPDDQSLGVITAVRAALVAIGHSEADVAEFAHSTTTGTNALLEGTVARTALVTTAGFGDLLWLRRQDRSSLYRLDAHHPPPLVEREHVVEVDERMGPEGVRTPLTDNALLAVVDVVAALDVEAVAIGLLFSYAHPEHERRLAEAIATRCPGVRISTSAEVVPAIREYERISTTTVDAALGPVLGRYLERLVTRATQVGLPEPSLMQSNGGRIGLHEAARHAAWTVLSGPAAGVMGAAALAGRSGVTDALTLDMGGTSTDVATIVGGRPGRSQGTTIAGHSVKLPVLDISTVSAGGGSVAWVDAGGALRVGPRSAGALPGPAAYGLGGTEATVTDANAVLGRLPEMVGGIQVNVDAARQAVRRVADPLGMTVATCAEAIIIIAVSEMARALRLVSVERGIDPRELVLVAFGGAGPLHAAQVADELGIESVLVPSYSGGLAALGLVVAGERRDFVQTILAPLDASDALTSAFATLTGRAASALPGGTIEVSADCRYLGQRHELTTPWSNPPDPADLKRAFSALHRDHFGRDGGDRPVEVVSLRAAVSHPGVPIDDATGPPRSLGDGPQLLPLVGSTLWLPRGWTLRQDTQGAHWMERR